MGLRTRAATLRLFFSVSFLIFLSSCFFPQNQSGECAGQDINVNGDGNSCGIGDYPWGVWKKIGGYDPSRNSSTIAAEHDLLFLLQGVGTSLDPNACMGEVINGRLQQQKKFAATYTSPNLSNCTFSINYLSNNGSGDNPAVLAGGGTETVRYHIYQSGCKVRMNLSWLGSGLEDTYELAFTHQGSSCSGSN